MSNEEIPKYFQLPITYLSEKSNLKETISKDLELTETIDPSGTPIYDFAFRPQTTLGKIMMSEMAAYYTSDGTYLKETQDLLRSYSPKKTIEQQTEIKEMVELFDEVKLDTGFKERYFYIDWEYWESLNRSDTFLQYMSIYNMASPVLSLLSPICIMIIPFFILKARGVDVTLPEYIQVLKMVASNNAIGRIFTHFHSVPNDQKVYLIVSGIFYLISIYQSILSCIRFYVNMKKIHRSLLHINTYIVNTTNSMEDFLEQSEKCTTYQTFNQITREKISILKQFKERLDEVRGTGFSLGNTGQIGKLLKMFYEFYCDDKLHGTFLYSFGFHGYVEILTGLGENIKEGKMAFAEFTTNSADDNTEDKPDKNNKPDKNDKTEKNKKKKPQKNKIKFNNLYYGPLIDKTPVKNSVKLDKNIIITGPNASGKTTVLKSTLINLIITQQLGCGFYESAELTPIKYIHCYLNIPDTSGRDSLFQAEARRCKEIIDIIQQTSNTDTNAQHFCVFDELYSGTNPEEAVTSALAFMEFLVKFKNVKCILTTHFIKVCKKLAKNKNVENYCMETMKDGKDFSYTYLLKNGISEVRGGFKVLQDMNYPSEILQKCP